MNNEIHSSVNIFRATNNFSGMRIALLSASNSLNSTTKVSDILLNDLYLDSWQKLECLGDQSTSLLRLVEAKHQEWIDALPKLTNEQATSLELLDKKLYYHEQTIVDWLQFRTRAYSEPDIRFGNWYKFGEPVGIAFILDSAADPEHAKNGTLSAGWRAPGVKFRFRAEDALSPSKEIIEFLSWHQEISSARNLPKLHSSLLHAVCLRVPGLLYLAKHVNQAYLRLLENKHTLTLTL